MNADQLFVVILVSGSILIWLAAKAFRRPRRPDWDEEVVPRIMELPTAEQERLEYAVEKILEHQAQGPSLDELLAQFNKLTDEQQQAELAELRRRVKERRAKGQS